MSRGRQRRIERTKAFKKWKKSFGRLPTDEERMIFYTSFGMGWKEGKKRQRQLTKEEEEKK